MIQDSLDIFNPRARFTATGIFYKNRPELGDGGEEFSFEYVNPYSSVYRRLFAGIQGESGEVAISTNDPISPKNNESYVLLQDGNLYVVEQVEVDYREAEKQAMRVFAVPLGTTTVMRLLRIENDWGVK